MNNQDRALKVGLIGYGLSGKTFHAPIITAVPDLYLAKVVERSSELSKERYPWIEIERDVKSLYKDPAIDIVVITTPSTNHYTFAKDALLAGKHVIVEKPFTAASEEAEELITLAKDMGKVISVFHNRRWDGDYMTVKQLLEQGLLGEIVEAEFRWDRFTPNAAPGKWRNNGELPGSGVFYDLGVHFMDQALSLFGMPSSITADIRTQREGAEADDGFEVTLGYASKLKVRLHASLLARKKGPRYAIHGRLGSFVKYGEDPQEDMLMNDLTPKDAGYAVDSEGHWGQLDTMAGKLRLQGSIQTLTGGYQHYYQNIADHIHGKADLAVKPEEASAAVRLIELGLQSSREARTIMIS
ncbi:oxidoreductase [Paenibacillus sp. HB172176]|uniref:oxidoreductase n=1 Tax=Paenibacillus sp. HB172176 TaxID=2493690 RepID=UPI0014388756|nr:oxidoreductase [Paenibacillus sp. HB172176]